MRHIITILTLLFPLALSAEPLYRDIEGISPDCSKVLAEFQTLLPASVVTDEDKTTKFAPEMNARKAERTGECIFAFRVKPALAKQIHDTKWTTWQPHADVGIDGTDYPFPEKVKPAPEPAPIVVRGVRALERDIAKAEVLTAAKPIDVVMSDEDLKAAYIRINGYEISESIPAEIPIYEYDKDGKIISTTMIPNPKLSKVVPVVNWAR